MYAMNVISVKATVDGSVVLELIIKELTRWMQCKETTK